MTIPKKSFRYGCMLTGILALISILVLLFAVEASPLYPINDWVDPNCFLTVGKGIVHGKVPYRDLYEQKGPYVYFLHALCYILSPDSFFGVFLVEAALCCLLLFFVWKILALYGVDDLKKVVCVAALICLTVYFSFASSTGDSVEELCNPFLLSIVYLTLKRVKKQEKFRFYDFLYIGLVAGVVFWSKFTVVAFFIGWYAFYLYRVIRQKNTAGRKIGEIASSTGLIVAGVAVATLPPLIYFAANHAVGDWLGGYLYDNLFLYKDEGGFFLHLIKTFGYIAGTLFCNIQYTFFAVLGIIWFSRKKSGAEREERMFFLLTPAIMAFFLYIGGRGYRYYGLPLSIFTVFGYIAALQIGRLPRRIWQKSLVAVAALASCIIFFFINGNNSYIFRKKEDTVQFKFAAIINQKEDAVLFNYGFLDGGFYFAAKKTPDFKYFCKLNIPKIEMEEETEKYVSEARPDFIVAKLWKYNTVTVDETKYTEVAREKERYREQFVTYVLYERIP